MDVKIMLQITCKTKLVKACGDFCDLGLDEWNLSSLRINLSFFDVETFFTAMHLMTCFFNNTKIKLNKMQN
jgi:hypothetical protein